MRNTTKLKTLLLKFTVSLDMDEDGLFKLMLTDKQTNEGHLLHGKSYSDVLSKAYSHLLKTMRQTEHRHTRI